MPREYSGSAHSMGRSARRRGPGAISLRGGTQLRRLARRIQESSNQGAVAAEAIYRKWKGGTFPLKAPRGWIRRNSKWGRQSSKAELTPPDVVERGAFPRRSSGRDINFRRSVIYIDGHSAKKVNIRRVRAEVVRGRVRGKYRPVVNGRAQKTSEIAKRHARNSIPATALGGPGALFRDLMRSGYSRGCLPAKAAPRPVHMEGGAPPSRGRRVPFLSHYET